MYLPALSLPCKEEGEDNAFTSGEQSSVAYIHDGCNALNHRPLHRDYVNSPMELMPEDIYSFALQIAEGMSHLEKLNVSPVTCMCTVCDIGSTKYLKCKLSKFSSSGLHCV